VHREAAYDPGFASAVSAGSLTVQQAIERGDRRALSARLAQRHRLPSHLALQVADNRITVRQALALKVDEENKEVPRPQTSVSHGVWNFMVYSIGALILCGLGVHIYHVWGEYLALRGAKGFATEANAAVRPQPATPPVISPAPPPAMTASKSDAVGQVTEITGPDPRSVLISFCETGRQSGRREPVEIAPVVPPHLALRLGIFRSLDQPGAPSRAIRIREDSQTGRWVAGDGRGPIQTEVPPAQPPGTQTIPVGARTAPR